MNMAAEVATAALTVPEGEGLLHALDGLDADERAGFRKSVKAVHGLLDACRKIEPKLK